MKNIQKKYRLSILILAYAVILGLAIYFFAIPFVFTIKSLSNEVQSEIIDQQVDQSRLSKLSQMEDDWSYYQSNKDSMEVILKPENQLEFIESIEAIASKTNNIIDLKIEESPDPREIEKMKKESNKTAGENKSILGNISFNSYFPAQIGLKGDYAGLVNFINMLENSRIYVNIISIESHKELVEDNSQKKEDIFSADAKKEEPVKKEILASVIRAVVYTKN